MFVVVRWDITYSFPASKFQSVQWHQERPTLLLTLAAVAEHGLNHRRFSVCFSARYLKDRINQDHQTRPRNVLRRVLKTHLFFSQKINGQGYESQKHCRRGSLHSCECWLLLYYISKAADCLKNKRNDGPRSSFFGASLVFFTYFLSFQSIHCAR